MSAETTPKLETFLIVAYRPMRGSHEKKELSLTPVQFNKMLGKFRISERQDVFDSHVCSHDRTCVVSLSTRDESSVAYVGVGSSQFYFVQPGKSKPKLVTLQGEDRFFGCDLVLFWKDRLVVGIGESGISVVEFLTSRILCRSGSRIGKIGRFGYGRGARIHNNCILLAANSNKMALVPLHQFWDFKNNVGI